MRVISNTFSLTAVPDVQAVRPNLVHCSQFTKDRLGWWILPSSSNAASFGVNEGMYGIDGYNAYEVMSLPGTIADIRQYLAKEYRASQADYNNETSNYALDAGKWYTLSFKVRGIAKKQNSDGSYSAGGDTRLYVYLVGYNGGGVTIVDTSEKYIVDGVEKSPSVDMNTSFVLNWTVTTHTITFKTRSDLKTISNHAAPVLYFRSFGEGHTTYPTYFANGGCLFRIAAIKIEEGMEATAYTPHATEMQPPVHAVAFKRENTDISGTTPTGGTYTSPTPTGWSDGIPTGEARLWETKAVFVPELPSATWSKPSPVGDTSDSDVEFSPYDGTHVSDVSNNLAAAGTVASPTTNKWFDPVRNAGADFSKMIWRAERQKKNGTWGSWAIVKVKGETGEPGKKGEDGKDAVTLDLDNQMDSVVCDNNGNLLAETTIQTTLRLYDGATLKASEQYDQLKEADFELNGIIPVKTVSRDSVTCTFSWTFNAGRKFSDARYIKDFSIQYNSTYYLATFTLNAMRNGENGDDAVRYNVSASESAITFKRKSDNSLSPSSVVLKCNVVKTVGETISLVSSTSYNVPGASLYLYYKRVVGYETNWQTLTISSGEVTVRSSDEISAIKFCLSTASSYSNVDSNIIDIETVPVVIDGLNGSNGNNGINGIDGVTLDFLSSANTIMLDDSGVEPKSITFRAMSAQGENAPSDITSSMYGIKVTEYVGNSAGSSLTVYCHVYTSGYPWTIRNTTTLTKIVAELIYNDGGNETTIRTLTIPVVKKGADGRSYNPVPRGVYVAGNTYVWDAKQRDYVDYEFDGVYYRFGVKTYGMTVTAAPTKAEGDAYWEVCDRVSCLITNCIFGTNAVIGGFVVTEGKFMSTENAYALRYMRSYETTNKVNYRGAWTGSGTSYAKDEAVYYNGTYYYSMTSGNTATPSGSSNWASCSNLLIERIKEVGTGTVYLYEYDNATLKRPVVQFGGTYYTTKKMGAATTSPTSSNSNWRELTDNELSFLSVGNGNETTSILSYVPKYTLNGKNGTVVMLQADDTCWTYDDTGKQINGIPYGKRIEIVPASKSIDVYDEKGELALQVNGDTYATIDKAYGSGTLNPSYSKPSGSLTSGNIGTQKTTMSFITSSAGFVVKDYPLNLSVKCAYSVTAEEKRLTTTPSGNYGGIYAVPYMSGDYWVYRSDCRGSIMVQKLSDDEVSWSNHNLLTSISTVGISGITARYSGTLRCVLQPGTYRIVLVFTADLFGSSNTGGYSSTCSYKVTDMDATGSYAVKTSRVFSNGLAFGSATNDNFVVCREEKGIHVKASTSSSYGFELSQTKGLEVKRGGQQGIVPVLLYAGKFAYLSTGKSQKTIYSYSGDVTYSWPHIGICEITFPWDCDSDKCVPTVTTWKGATGVSARIVSWNARKMVIEIDNDYSGGAGTGSDHDYGGFYIKLEYIGTINN